MAQSDIRAQDRARTAVVQKGYTITAFNAYTVNSTAAGFGTTGNNKYYAFVSLDRSAQPVRFRLDGTNPTAVTGHRFETGTHMEVLGQENIGNFKFRKLNSTSTTIFASFGV